MVVQIPDGDKVLKKKKKEREMKQNGGLWYNERCQSQKTTYYMIPFIRKVQNRQIHMDRKHMNGGQGLKGRENEA